MLDNKEESLGRRNLLEHQKRKAERCINAERMEIGTRRNHKKGADEEFCGWHREVGKKQGVCWNSPAVKNIGQAYIN